MATEATFQPPMGWLKAVAELNTYTNAAKWHAVGTHAAAKKAEEAAAKKAEEAAAAKKAEEAYSSYSRRSTSRWAG